MTVIRAMEARVNHPLILQCGSDNPSEDRAPRALCRDRCCRIGTTLAGDRSFACVEKKSMRIRILTVIEVSEVMGDAHENRIWISRSSCPDPGGATRERAVSSACPFCHRLSAEGTLYAGPRPEMARKNMVLDGATYGLAQQTLAAHDKWDL